MKGGDNDALVSGGYTGGTTNGSILDELVPRYFYSLYYNHPDLKR